MPEDVEELVDLRVAVEERPTRVQLGEDAPDAPEVESERVTRLAHENLGRAVPQSDHLMRERAHRHSEGSREPEVRDLQHVVRVHKQVLRLQVTMDQATQMAVVEPLKQLVH